MQYRNTAIHRQCQGFLSRTRRYRIFLHRNCLLKLFIELWCDHKDTSSVVYLGTIGRFTDASHWWSAAEAGAPLADQAWVCVLWLAGCFGSPGGVFPFPPEPVDALFIHLSQIFYCSPVSLSPDPNFPKQPWCWASYIAPAPHLDRVQLHSPALVPLLWLLVCLINCILPRNCHFDDIWWDLDQTTRFDRRVVIAISGGKWTFVPLASLAQFSRPKLEDVRLVFFTPSEFPPLRSPRSPALLVPQPWSIWLLPPVVALPLRPFGGGGGSQASALLDMADNVSVIEFRVSCSHKRHFPQKENTNSAFYKKGCVCNSAIKIIYKRFLKTGLLYFQYKLQQTALILPCCSYC